MPLDDQPDPAPADGPLTPSLLHTGAGPRSRVLMRGDVVWEPATGPPATAAELTQGWEVAADLEPAARTVTVGPEWVDLLGKLASLTEDWPGPPSLVYVENRVGLDYQVRPSPTQLASDAARVVELAVPLVPAAPGRARPALARFAVVRPQRGWPLEPLGPVWARCQAGPVKLRLVALPPALGPNGPPLPRLAGEAEPEGAVLGRGGVVSGGDAVEEYGAPTDPRGT